MSIDDATGAGTSVIWLDRDKALEYGDWSSAARRYLKTQPTHIPLRELVTGYAADIEDVYAWLYDQFPELHGSQVDEVNELIGRLRGDVPDWTDPPTPPH